MTDTNFLAGHSSLWVQPDGPNTKPEYLGCHGVGDVTEPLGDETFLYCPDPATPGKYIVKNSYTGEPGAITFTIDTDLRKTADYLETISKCGVPIYVHKVVTGRRDEFTNFDRTFIFYPTKFTQRTLGNLASRQPGDENESTQSFDASALAILRAFYLEAARVSISDTGDLVGVAICGEERCETETVASQQLSDYIFSGTKVLGGSAAATAEVMISTFGSTFAVSAADPFADAVNVGAITCFRVGKDTVRILVAKGTTEAGEPLTIAYSDDLGATWTTVEVGVTDAEFCSGPNALFSLDRYHIWLGSNLGRIYFSEDGGLTWSTQEDAVISATAVMGISFSSVDIGFAIWTGGEVARTLDGSQSGATWSAVTTSGATTAKDIVAINSERAWAAGATGLFCTVDGGDTWVKRITPAIGCVDFYSDMIGLALGSASSAPIYQTVDGGYDWSILPTIANAGFNDVKILATNLAYAVGAASGGSGMMIKLLPQA